ncbi:MAG TPA: hypothetical protein P5228_02160 [Bacteroidales bacterium]|nr:hypothetical protein [Bacteroidales bacterium]HRZ50040.1 hypothetical protein [Bacteroidales bacterium]
MKRLLMFVTLLGASALFFSSCVTTHQGFQSSPVLVRDVELDPIKADIRVSDTEKLTGESVSTYLFFFRISGDRTYADGIYYSTEAADSTHRNRQTSRLNRVRASAAYKALSKGDYDLLIHPTYVMTTRSYLGIVRSYECKVSGYGAKYYNFRTEKQQVIILNNGTEMVFPE